MRFQKLLFLLCVALAACSTSLVEVPVPVVEPKPLLVNRSVEKPTEQPQRIASMPLVIIGEGGTSGFLFQYAAETYLKENGGVSYTVHDGDEFMKAMQNFVKEHGAISHFVYIGHGNEVGLYVNQAPHVNGALYVNDPALNSQFRAASIYDLLPDIFAPGGTALFYGCNVAREYEGQDSFAEQFANHFHVQVTAPIGPTEFSFEQEGKRFLTAPAKGITQPLYMVPTVAEKGFITIEPSPAISAGYDDVFISSEAGDAIAELTKRGLALSPDRRFRPYQAITYGDARAFCRILNPEAPCTVENFEEGERLRNTAALKMLLDAAGFPLKRTSIPYQVQISFATRHNLLTRDFIHRRWYTRAEMAMLTSAILTFKEGKE